MLFIKLLNNITSETSVTFLLDYLKTLNGMWPPTNPCSDTFSAAWWSVCVRLWTDLSTAVLAPNICLS